jgi:hypothetical protein
MLIVENYYYEYRTPFRGDMLMVLNLEPVMKYRNINMSPLNGVLILLC